jgi:hypothetical protein
MRAGFQQHFLYLCKHMNFYSRARAHESQCQHASKTEHGNEDAESVPSRLKACATISASPVRIPSVSAFSCEKFASWRLHTKCSELPGTKLRELMCEIETSCFRRTRLLKLTTSQSLEVQKYREDSECALVHVGFALHSDLETQ